MDNGPPYEMKISRIPWDPNNYILSQSDYMLSILLETADMYMIMPNKQKAFLWIHNRGLVGLMHDFSHHTEEETELFILNVRRHIDSLG